MDKIWFSLILFLFSFDTSKAIVHPSRSFLHRTNLISLAFHLTPLVPSLICSTPPHTYHCPPPQNRSLSVLAIKMPATQTLQARSPPTYPIGVPGKSIQYTPLARAAPYSRPAISPPQPGSSANTSAVPSLTSGSYSGSIAGDENSNAGASGVDLVELLNDRLSNAVDPVPLDRSLARQAQTLVYLPFLASKYRSQRN